jgi:hypothetical protein
MITLNLPNELVMLHKAAFDAARRFETSAEGVFDPCGLILEMLPAKDYYWCTPTNVLTFAITGGDGVHYSYLSGTEFTGEKRPIVMTLPCADGQNVIVADSFEEFFNLGFFVGWFSLEQLIYQPNEAVEYFARHDEGLQSYAGTRMEFLREALGIRPVPPSLDRLRSLKQEYYELLNIPEFRE